MDNKQKNARRPRKQWLEALLEKPWAAYTAATCSAVILFLALSHINVVFSGIGMVYSLLTPIVIGVVIAYLINPLANCLENRFLTKISRENTRHNLAVVLALCFVILAIVLLLVTLIPALVDSFSLIISNMNTYVAGMQDMVNHISSLAARFHLDVSGFTALSQDLITRITEGVTHNIGTILSTSYSIGAGAFNGFIGFMLAIYFLLDKKNLMNGINHLRSLILTEKAYERNTTFWGRCHKILGQYIIYDIVDALIIGFLNAIFMLVAGLPFKALLSLIVGVTNLLPTFGPIIGCVICCFILVLINPVQALIFLIFTIILQTVDSYIIKPKLFGTTMGIPDVWVLITLTIGGNMFGIIGILLAIPFTAIFIFLYKETILPWLAARKANREEDDDE